MRENVETKWGYGMELHTGVSVVITDVLLMATTLDAVVKLNTDRKALRSARVRSVQKELLQLLRSAPKHFQSKTPLSAKQLLNRYI
jgi:hypothetical protein